jgi:predicted nucleotidyltransferase
MVTTFATLAEAIQTQHLLQKYRLPRLGVFGSFARGEAYQDVDFFVDTDADLHLLIGLKTDLEQILQTDVDIMVKKYANPIVLHRAQKDMKYVSQ